jgi:N-acetylglutamate synthase-like GNAT family acetyltransferase
MHAAQSLEPLVSSPVDPIVSASVRRAGPRDLPGLVRLINAAYEIERFFVDGERTDEEELAALTRVGHFLILDRRGAGGLAAAVYVRVDGDHGYFGMLAVAPDLRGHGLGRRMVGVAEAMCTALGCAVMDLKIVNVREELGPWYRSLGYEEVGTEPFPVPSKRPCHFVWMSKPLAE